MKLNWGWRIAIVYTIFAVSTVTFVAFAMTKDVELVRKDYYEASLKYDETFAAERRAKDLSEPVSIELTQAILNITLPSSHTDLQEGKVTFYRPENSQLDRNYALVAGATSIPLSELVKGTYNVQVEWSFENDSYRAVQQIEIP